MFDAERLLGGLISQGLGGKRRRRRNLKWSLGVGAVGLAIAAWEHFNQTQASDPTSQQTATPPAAPPPPPPASSGAPATDGSAPVARGTRPPLPPQRTPLQTAAASATEADRNDDAMLLIRAMICAASADGTIDAKEQSRIIERLVAAGLGSDERAFLAREFAAPPDPKALFGSVRNAQLAEQIYTVSTLTIDVDDAKEHAYLRGLAEWLGLSAERLADLELRISGRAR